MRLSSDDQEAGNYRFKFLELVRADVQELRATIPPDDVPQVLIYIAYADLKGRGVTIDRVGAVDDLDATAELFEAVREAIIKQRHENDNGEVIIDAPETARILGVGHVFGARDLAGSMQGASSGEILAEGYVCNLVFTDLSTAFFVGQASGQVNLAGCSARLGFVENYLITHPVDRNDLDSIPPGTKMQPGDSRPIEVELGLTMATLTASVQELSML